MIRLLNETKPKDLEGVRTRLKAKIGALVKEMSVSVIVRPKGKVALVKIVFAGGQTRSYAINARYKSPAAVEGFVTGISKQSNEFWGDEPNLPENWIPIESPAQGSWFYFTKPIDNDFAQPKRSKRA
jgi:hypothetical protein